MPRLRFGLGRLPAPDPRDHHYALRKVAPKTTPRAVYRHWRTGAVLDQGSTSQCVAYSWTAFLHSSPLRTKIHLQPEEFYRAAQKVDEWEGENYDGTSVRAGAKVLQAEGHLAQYLWASRIDEICNWVLSANGGPVVMGTDWYEGMFHPDSKGRVKLYGPAAGGHAWIIYGYNQHTQQFHCQNSWGTGWGKKGKFRITLEDAEKLLQSYGEACTAIEQVKVKPAQPVEEPVTT